MTTRERERKIVTIKDLFDKDVETLTDEELSEFLNLEKNTEQNGGTISNKDFNAAKKEKAKRNENIKIAEEQGKIIYGKKYPFYIDMDKINQVPIYLNTKENLIKLKKTITGIIDDYEKNKDKFYYPNNLGNNSEDEKESHYKDIMRLKNKMNQIEEKLESFE